MKTTTDITSTGKGAMHGLEGKVIVLTRQAASLQAQQGPLARVGQRSSWRFPSVSTAPTEQWGVERRQVVPWTVSREISASGHGVSVSGRYPATPSLPGWTTALLRIDNYSKSPRRKILTILANQHAGPDVEAMIITPLATEGGRS
ncbi:hypothetical protein J2Y68_003220 [Paenarthrobacter nitroguajacolicus]|nr:hypothetical protein [Paenarthrobacter nitroguajacolicus]